MQKLKLEEKLAKSKAKVRVLEKLEGSSSYGRSKMRLAPTGTTYREIKHDDDVLQYIHDLEN